MAQTIQLLPKETFDIILQHAVIPTFDLLLEYGDQGLVFVKRKIPPYENIWAFPGLRMFKSESIDDTLKRIAIQELDLKIDPEDKILIGQFVAKFKTEHNRQDLSTGYYIKISGQQKITKNDEHFSDMKISYTMPTPIGAMYNYYFEEYRKLQL